MRKLQVTPLEYGAIPNDDQDDSAAFQEAILAAKHIYIPPGIWDIDTPIDVWQWAAAYKGVGVRIEGAGPQTVLRFNGESGYCLDMLNADDPYNRLKTVGNNIIENLHIQAPSIPDIDSGGCIRVTGTMNSIHHVWFSSTKGTAIAIEGRPVGVAGDYSAENECVEFQTHNAAIYVESASLMLSGKGSAYYEIRKGSQLIGTSEVKEIDTSGEAVCLEFPYHRGYEVEPHYTRVRPNTEYTLIPVLFDGLKLLDGKYNIEIKTGQPFGNHLSHIIARGAGGIGRFLSLDSGAITYVSHSNADAQQAVSCKIGSLDISNSYLYGKIRDKRIELGLDMAGDLRSTNCWWELSRPSKLKGYNKNVLISNVFGGNVWSVEPHTEIEVFGRQPYWAPDTIDKMRYASPWANRVILANGGRWRGNSTLQCNKRILERKQYMGIAIGRSTVESQYYGEPLPPGIYTINVYAKGDKMLVTATTGSKKTTRHNYQLTSEYMAYEFIWEITPKDYGIRKRQFFNITNAGNDPLYISKMVWELQ
jgi:hypothetical protein